MRSCRSSAGTCSTGGPQPSIPWGSRLGGEGGGAAARASAVASMRAGVFLSLTPRPAPQAHPGNRWRASRRAAPCCRQSCPPSRPAGTCSCGLQHWRGRVVTGVGETRWKHEEGAAKAQQACGHACRLHSMHGAGVAPVTSPCMQCLYGKVPRPPMLTEQPAGVPGTADSVRLAASYAVPRLPGGQRLVPRRLALSPQYVTRSSWPLKSSDTNSVPSGSCCTSTGRPLKLAPEGGGGLGPAALPLSPGTPPACGWWREGARDV